MIEKLKYIVASSLILVLTTSLVACSDDPMEPDAWDSTYVYLEKQILGSEAETFYVAHTSEGISGDVILPIVVKLSKVCASDVTVTLRGAIRDSLMVQTSTKVISAGQLFVRDTMRFTDWDFALTTKPQTEYLGAVKIVEMTPQTSGLRISPKLGSDPISVIKSVYSNMVVNKRPLGARIADRTPWVVKWAKSDAVGQIWTATTKCTDNQTSTYVERANSLAFEIDLGSVQKVSGLENYNLNIYYAHSQCSIAVSEDGEKWTDLLDGNKATISQTKTQYVAFTSQQNVRYLRWYMWGGECMSGELYVWAK